MGRAGASGQIRAVPAAGITTETAPSQIARGEHSESRGRIDISVCVCLEGGGVGANDRFEVGMVP
jgi:hypothetical protein